MAQITLLIALGYEMILFHLQLNYRCQKKHGWAKEAWH